MRVDGVFPDSPAQRVGIEPGDLIVAVDGESIAGGEDSQLSTEKIKGPEGSKVTIGVLKDGDVKPRQLEVTRETSCCRW